MYRECILKDSCILLYSDMYPKRDTGVTDLHLRYMSDTSGYMYLGRFLGVTLDTYQETSGYMYLGRFITIHQDTPRYKITIHVSWTRHDDTSRYNQDT